MKKLSFLLLLASVSLSAQTNPKGVGINTTSPTKDLDVNGEARLRNRPQGAITDSLLVTNSLGEVRRLHINQLVSQNSGTCPAFNRSVSTGYYIQFSSPSSVPNPNNPLTIQNKNFVGAGTWTSNNIYYFSWTNTSGQALNINNPFTVLFGGTLSCTYTP